MPSSIRHSSFGLRHSAAARRRGFTLLEVLLALAVAVMLAAMVWPAVSQQLTRRQLVSSADQLRSLLYFASAEARLRGRRIEVRLPAPPPADQQPEDGAEWPEWSAEVRIEADPLAAPGQFELLNEPWASWQPTGRLVHLHDVQIAEPLPMPGEDSAAGQADASPAWLSILFAPDGRSMVGDVTIELGDEIGRAYRVYLRASTGQTTIAPVVAESEEEAE